LIQRVSTFPQTQNINFFQIRTDSRQDATRPADASDKNQAFFVVLNDFNHNVGVPVS